MQRDVRDRPVEIAMPVDKSLTPLPGGWSAPLRLLVRALVPGEARSVGRHAARRIADGMSRDDWDTVAELAVERHRVAPLLVDAFAEVGMPEPALSRIRSAARQAAFAALEQKAETLRLARAFRSEGIDPVLLKGWALAERIHGSAARRQTRDLDLLVRDIDFAAAVRCLAREGYGPVESETPLDPAEIETNGIFKDVEFARAGQGFTLELHARSNAYRGWPALFALEGGIDRMALDASGLDIAVPSMRGNLVYLSLHGMQHMFCRLRWLHDIAVLVAARPDEVLAADLAAAERIAAGRFVRVAVALANRVFSSPWPASWAPPSAAERFAVSFILSAIAAPDFAGHGAGASIRRVLLKFLVAETPRQRISLLADAGQLVLGGRKGA